MKKGILILLAVGALLKLGSWEHSYQVKDCRIAEVGNGYVVVAVADEDTKVFYQTNKVYQLNEKVNIVMSDNCTINNTSDDYIIDLKEER